MKQETHSKRFCWPVWESIGFGISDLMIAWQMAKDAAKARSLFEPLIETNSDRFVLSLALVGI